MSTARTLVVGTTSDYIDLIRRRWPGRALFLTDRRIREQAREPAPTGGEEILCDLLDEREAKRAVVRHRERHRLEPAGIACYDCESLPLAASLAEALGLPWHSREAVEVSRCKLRTKMAWTRAQVACPRHLAVHPDGDLEMAVASLGLPVILKPLSGAGSELVHLCRTRREVNQACLTMGRSLAAHTDRRLYPHEPADSCLHDPRGTVLFEEFVPGPEFSCDFLLNENRVEIVRLAGKVLAPELGAGTALAYWVPANGALGLPASELASRLAEAAAALGFIRGLFMVDFILRGGQPVFLELSPRPSGDCLPPLVRASSGFDIIGLALDLAEERSVTVPGSDRFAPMAGVRFFATEPGVLRDLSLEALRQDPRVVEAVAYREAGHRVILPPEDYFSRILGHAIFRTDPGADLAAECREISALLAAGFDRAA